MRVIISLLLIICCCTAQSQVVKQKNSISANYGASYSVYATDRIGSASVDGFAHNFGIQYNRHFSMDLSFETGLRYTSHSLNVNGINSDGTPFDYDAKSSYINAPFLVEYKFLSYLFAQLGPTVSIQLDSDLDNNQSGIGVWGAFGVKIPINNCDLKIYPYYHSQSLISFSADHSYYSLQNIGLNIGFGYRF